MQASLIRDKYKQILEEPESEDSEDEWEIAYSQMAKQRKKRILTEASPNKNYQENGDGSQAILALKQKLAQCLSNCKEHCKEIDRMRKQQVVFEEERAEWREGAAQVNRILEEEREANRINQQKISSLQMQISSLNNRIQELSMDRELQYKQSEYYRTELSQLKEEYDRREKEHKQNEKQFRLFEKIRKQNDYLRNDVERLALLIQDSMRFGKVSGELMKKHFLGKPHKEMDYWYPQQLVGEVELFLKKNQVGYGNKDFTSNLVKFVERLSERATKESQLKIKNIHSVSKTKENSSSVKKPCKVVLDNSTYKKHSYNISSMRDDAATKSNTSSFWKAAESRILHDSQSPNCWQLAIKTACWQTITQFKSIVFQLLLQKEIKRKKIKKLVDSMCSSVMQAFQAPPCDKKDPFSSLKLEITDITAPLKAGK